MGLSKTRTILGGFSTTYIRIESVDVKKEGSAIIEVYLYKDRTHALANPKDGIREVVGFSSGFDDETLLEEGNSPTKQGYIKLKESVLDENENETNWFHDATDVIES